MWSLVISRHLHLVLTLPLHCDKDTFEMRLHGPFLTSHLSVLASHVQWLVLGILSLAFAQHDLSSPPWAACRAFLLHREMEPRARLQATQQQQQNNPLYMPHPFPPCHFHLPHRFLQSERSTGHDPAANKPTIGASASTFTQLSYGEDAKR
jgi:hypothetical protein